METGSSSSSVDVLAVDSGDLGPASEVGIGPCTLDEGSGLGSATLEIALSELLEVAKSITEEDLVEGINVVVSNGFSGSASTTVVGCRESELSETEVRAELLDLELEGVMELSGPADELVTVMIKDEAAGSVDSLTMEDSGVLLVKVVGPSSGASSVGVTAG